MIRIDFSLKPEGVLPDIHRMWERSARCIESIEQTFDPAHGAPVFTVAGRYTARGWTEWTQGFQYGAALLQFDATGDQRFLEIGRRNTVERMAPHLTHFGVHDHGFNNISTYGHLLRLAREGRIDGSPWEIRYYALALQVSGAVQARRWTSLGEHGGYIYSFNGPHSLFADTIRRCASLARRTRWDTSTAASMTSGSRCSNASFNTPQPPRAGPCTTAKGVTPTTSEGG